MTDPYLPIDAQDIDDIGESFCAGDSCDGCDECMPSTLPEEDQTDREQ